MLTEEAAGNAPEAATSHTALARSQSSRTRKGLATQFLMETVFETFGQIPNIYRCYISSDELRQEDAFCALPPVEDVAVRDPSDFRHVGGVRS